MNESQEGDRLRRKTEVFIRWTAPPIVWTSLNINAAARGTPGLAGGGGVFRDQSGGFKRAFAASLGVCSAFRAEMMALAKGLEMARQMGITRLFVQMDNENCVKILTKQVVYRGECVQIVHLCNKML